ncbi:hypothetical protein Noda2021_01320 [Candidatus Dependentiae bacterium Noda2021]|nr:hypothetical protein Noda2021_01320 [Candidatus Dependentiae bacterium Noda2021]
MTKVLSVLALILLHQYSFTMQTTEHRGQKRKFSDTQLVSYENDIVESINAKIAAFFVNGEHAFLNFDDVKKYIKNHCTEHIQKNSRKVLNYHCPYPECSFSREKNIDEVASCLLSHYSNDFFDCPHCEKNLKRIGGLKVHFKNFHCTTQAHAAQNNPLTQNLTCLVIKLKKYKPTTKPDDLPRLIINPGNQTRFVATPITSCLSNSSDFITPGTIENVVEEFEIQRFDN